MADHTPEHTAQQMREEQRRREGKKPRPLTGEEAEEAAEPAPKSVAGQQEQTPGQAEEGEAPR